MNEVLLTAGALCVIAAVIGGGLEAFGARLPAVSSLPRQAALFVLGVGFLLVAYVLRADGAGAVDPGLAAYQQRAASACDRMVETRQADLPLEVYALDDPGSIRLHKEPLLRELRRRRSVLAAELTSLWRTQPPAGLRDEQQSAKAVTQQWLGRLEEQIVELESSAPRVVEAADAERLVSQQDTTLSAQANDAMSALAGQNCPVASG